MVRLDLDLTRQPGIMGYGIIMYNVACTRGCLSCLLPYSYFTRVGKAYGRTWKGTSGWRCRGASRMSCRCTVTSPSRWGTRLRLCGCAAVRLACAGGGGRGGGGRGA